jgi:hypothetical protein
MILEVVESKTIYKRGYDEKLHLLYIVFHHDKKTLYKYFNVPSSVFTAFKNNKSAGAFYNKYIKEKYKSTKTKLNKPAKHMLGMALKANNFEITVQDSKRTVIRIF